MNRLRKRAETNLPIPSVNTDQEAPNICIICAERARGVMFGHCIHIVCEECANRVMRGELIDPLDKFIEVNLAAIINCYFIDNTYNKFRNMCNM